MSSETETQNLKHCTMCKRLVLKLVPLYDHDQTHTKQLACKKCKKAIKAGIEIVKFARNEQDIIKLEKSTERKPQLVKVKR